MCILCVLKAFYDREWETDIDRHTKYTHKTQQITHKSQAHEDKKVVTEEKTIENVSYRKKKTKKKTGQSITCYV